MGNFSLLVMEHLMAFKHGVLAIAKALKVIAVVLGGVSFVGYIVSGEILIGLITGAFFFLLFWTPAWILRKFVQ